MTDVGIDPDGEAVWKWIVDDVGAMLLQLLGEPAAKVAEQVEIPAQKGVYLFSHGDRTVMVGLANDLKRELHAAVTPDAKGGSTYLSFYLARWMAKHSGVNVDRDRRHLETDPDFAAQYRRAKEIVPNLVVRFVAHRDLVQRQVLALYSEIHLNSAIPSGLYPERDGPPLVSLLPADRGDPPSVARTGGSSRRPIGRGARDRPVAAAIDPEQQNNAPDRCPRPSQLLLGRAIRQIRIEKHLKQEEVADRALIHEAYLSVIENGKRNPTWNVVTAISAALEVPIATLVARAEES